MTSVELPASHVTIGLKDVYQMVQGLDKTVADAFSALNLTMLSIKQHMESVDVRNAAADQIHAEHATRLAQLELSRPAETQRDFETRIRSLEKYKYLLLGGIVMLQALIGVVEYFVLHGVKH